MNVDLLLLLRILADFGLLVLIWLVQLVIAGGPFVGIDHIFVSDHFTPLSFRVVQQSAGSDHRPVVATLTVAAPNQ